jgi:hypothetical protein
MWSQELFVYDTSCSASSAPEPSVEATEIQKSITLLLEEDNEGIGQDLIPIY